MKRLLIAMSILIGTATVCAAHVVEVKRTIIRPPGLFRPCWTEKVVIKRQYLPQPRCSCVDCQCGPSCKCGVLVKRIFLVNPCECK